MKKVLSCLLAILILASMTVPAFATSSPEQPGAPTPVAPPYVPPVEKEEPAVVDGNGDDITDITVITTETDIDTLGDEDKGEFEAGLAELGELDLKALITKYDPALGEEIGERKLAIAEVFYVSTTEEVVFPVTMRLKLNDAENFVALIHRVDGEWIVEKTELKEDVLKTTVDSLGIFAIVVYAAEE